MEIKNEVKIYSQDNLNKELQNIINKQFKNKELIRNINMELASKNLNANLTAGLFIDNSISVSKLSQIEKIAITKVCYEFLKDESVNYRKYYEDEEIVDYKGYKSIEEKITEVILPYLQKIDEYNYVGRITYEQIYNYIKFVLFRYNKQSQRAYKTKNTGTKNEPIRIISIKQDNVDAMMELALKHKLEETQIIVNVRLPEGKENFEPNYKFIPLNKDLPFIGTLNIKPNYELDSPTFTVIDMLDGFHRMLAIYQAVEKYKEENNGEILQGGLDIRVVMRTLSEAQEIVRQIFQRSDTNTDFLKGFEQGDYADFLKLVEENSNTLRGKIAINYSEYEVEEKLTHKTILVDTLKLTEIPVDQKGKVRNIGKQIGETIDEIIESVKVKYFNDSLEEMKNNSSLLDCNMFVGYLAIADALRMLNDYSQIDKIVDNLYSIPESDLKKLKLKHSPSTVSYRDIHSYFTNLVMGVFKVA